MSKRSYAIRIKAFHQSGCRQVVAEILCREDDSASPINPRSDGERDYDETPKAVQGLLLSDLCLRAFQGSIYEGKRTALGPDLTYLNVYSADTRKVEMMAKTIRKAQKAIEKADAREPGDMLMAFCKALGVTQTVLCVDDTGRSSYSENKWKWMPLEFGRNLFRAAIADMAVVEAHELAGSAS